MAVSEFALRILWLIIVMAGWLVLLGIALCLALVVLGGLWFVVRVLFAYVFGIGDDEA